MKCRTPASTALKPTGRLRSRSLRRGGAERLLSGLALLPLVFSSAAAARECSGDDAQELWVTCSVHVDNEDLLVGFDPPGFLDGPPTDAELRQKLERAVLFVHGYGVAHTSPPRVLYEDGSEGFFADFQKAGINIVVIGPGNAANDSVEDDAAAVRRALALLNGYRGESALPWVVFGHSMGGLLARIALADMEAAGEPHHVGLSITYDTPHRGVHVPAGMQSLKLKLDEWAAMTEADFIAIDPGWEGVFNLASMVGMTTSLDPDSIQGFPDPTSLQAQQMTIQGIALPEAYPAFMQLLDETGFPAVPSIAVTNGNLRGVPNEQEVGPGGELFYFTGAKGNSFASVRGTFEVFTDNPGEICFKSHVYYDGLAQNHDGGRKDARAPDEMQLFDSFSGGTLDYAGEMLAVAERSRQDFHEPSFRAASSSAIPFVTTSSALGLPPTTPEQDIAALVAAGETPFDLVLASGDLPALPDNIDHNTIVLSDALLEEIHRRLPCAEGVYGDACIPEEEPDAGPEEPVECWPWPGPDAGCGDSDPTYSDEYVPLCSCERTEVSSSWPGGSSGFLAFGMWVLVRRRRR